MLVRKKMGLTWCENKKALNHQGFDLRNSILEWVFVISKIVHPAARLNEHAGTTAPAVIGNRLPGTGKVGWAKITAATIVFNEFLNMQQRAQLNGFQRTVPVLGNAYMGFAPVAFPHLVLRYIVIFGA